MTANQSDLFNFLKTHPNKLYTSKQLSTHFKEKQGLVGPKLMKLKRAGFIKVYYKGNAIKPYYVYGGKE